MSRTRQHLVFLTAFMLFTMLFARLFFLQVASFQDFRTMAREQHNRIIKLEPVRGAITDRFQEPIAVNLDALSVAADPRTLADKEYASTILSEITGEEKGVLLERFGRDKAFVWVKRRVGDDTVERIKPLGLKGVFFVKESKRNYPNDSMAAHVVGFAGVDNRGLEGIELLYDSRLKGKPGIRYCLRDANLRTVLDDDENSLAPENGQNIMLTIDSVIQYIVEEEIERTALKFNASSVSAVVMEPATGRILALANYPAYDLNSFESVPRSAMNNSVVTDVFEPGSVFKIVTASAAINEGRITTEEIIYCENGEYEVCRRVLHDFHPYGKLTFKDVISKSSNIGTVKVAQELGAEVLYDYVTRFGFGDKTGVELPGEVQGISRRPDTWSRSDITTIPIGQGIAVTTLQLAAATGVIANGGYLVKPFIVEKITTSEGATVYENKPYVKRAVLSRLTCQTMKDILHDVVTTGTGKNANSKKFQVCGKTGTAQMVNPNGGYFADKYYATFIGFAPKDDPEVVIVVTAKDPHPFHFGGTVAAPAFKTIAERTIEYLGSNKKSEEQ
jgi:cell division protein FtsI (penicillin-binding protein 3)